MISALEVENSPVPNNQKEVKPFLFSDKDMRYLVSLKRISLRVKRHFFERLYAWNAYGKDEIVRHKGQVYKKIIVAFTNVEMEAVMSGDNPNCEEGKSIMQKIIKACKYTLEKATHEEN